MKRNMDLIRTLLLAAEADVESISGESSVKEQAYHVALLKDAALVEAQIQLDPMGEPAGYIIFRLTWAGHEFLDSTREDTVWKKAKDHVLKPGATWTFDILKEWLKTEVKVKLGMPI